MNGPSEFHVVGTLKDWDIRTAWGNPHSHAGDLGPLRRGDAADDETVHAAASPARNGWSSSTAHTWPMPRSPSATCRCWATSSTAQRRNVQKVNDSAPKDDLRRPHVQVSLDLTSLDEALHVAEIAVRAGVDWLEAGTPLILAEGLRAVRGLHERFPDVPIVADLKTMDGGYLEVEMMARAGAAWCVVMGVAHPATVAACVAAARDYGIGLMGDILAAPDKVANARLLQELGVDVIIVHTGYDERHVVQGASPWDDLAAVVAAVDLPVQAVGGLRMEDLPRLPAAGAPLVVVGAPLVIADDAFRASESDDERLARVISEVVRAVKGESA